MDIKQFEQDERNSRFWDATSGLAEEQSLLRSWLDEPAANPEGAYARYLAESRRVPEDLADDIWNTLHRRRHFSRSISRWGIAASIAMLLTAVGFQVAQQRSKRIDQDFRQLDAALWFASEKVAPQPEAEILYVIVCKSDEKQQGSSGSMIEIRLKNTGSPLYTVCEGILYFGQDGAIQAMDIHEEKSPKLLVDCQEKPLCEIENIKPEQVKSIALHKNPNNCKGQKKGEYVVVEY
jgi:hypothetical protein